MRVVKAMEYEVSLIHGDPPIWDGNPDFSEENDPEGKLLDDYITSEVIKYKRELDIPDEVHLMDGYGLIMSDTPKFMKFAKWWVKGEMTDEIFDLFAFHYCEIVEVDFFWVLMDEPGDYYSGGSIPKEEAGFTRLADELRRIGTRSKKKARMNFKMNIGHDY